MKRAAARLGVAALVLLWSAPAHAQATAFWEAVAHKNAGRLEEAARLFRAEVARQTVGGSHPVDPVHVRQHLLIVLGDIAAARGATEALDAEAGRLYRDGVPFAGDNAERQALLLNGIALYYSKSYRNGLAVPYLQEELGRWERLGNPFRQVLGNDALASAFWDVGQPGMSALYRDRALGIAERYFVTTGFGPWRKGPPATEWQLYWTVLGSAMDKAAQLGNLELLERLWPRYEGIEAAHMLSNGAWSQLNGAQYFAAAGDYPRAFALLEKGSVLAEQARKTFPADRALLIDQALACARGMVMVFASRHGAATREIEQCISLTASTGSKEGEANIKLKLGQAYEGSGDAGRALAAYREAIASAEGSRASYGVAERGSFFRTLLRLPYWGVVRLQASSAARGDSEAFFDAVATSELVRSRQLGELIDPEAARRMTPAAVRSLQSRLPGDVAVLAYTLTDSHLVLLAMTRERTLSAVTEYDARAFVAKARSLAGDLARPTSAMDRLSRELQEFSAPLLAAVGPLLAGKSTILVLPDGPLNMVPFDLLSVSPAGYRPLIEDFTVRVVPSLRFVSAPSPRVAGEGALLAVADPLYVEPEKLAGTPVTALRSALRNSNFLSYFQRLPETREEAQAIGRIFGAARAELLVGSAAVESRLKATDLGRFRYLHFATHGILGGEVPGIGEPSLVLGPEPTEDGFLTATEVSRMKLDAELTVLSACNTGSGEFVTGEGVMAIGRAFMVAGSRAVVVSLWPVASRQTVEIMTAFYTHLQSGADVATALRRAKLDLRRRATDEGSIERHPFFWAPFAPIGG